MSKADVLAENAAFAAFCERYWAAKKGLMIVLADFAGKEEVCSAH